MGFYFLVDLVVKLRHLLVERAGGDWFSGNGSPSNSVRHGPRKAGDFSRLGSPSSTYEYSLQHYHDWYGRKPVNIHPRRVCIICYLETVPSKPGRELICGLENK
jgi:hypothetical protein